MNDFTINDPFLSPERSTDTAFIKPGNQPAELLQFEESMVAFFMQAADLLGVPKSLAIIYGIIFASPEPLCFADLDERLDISKGSISQGLRVLKEMGAIKPVEKTKDRKEYYEPDLELRKLITRFLDNKVQKQLDQGTVRLATLRNHIPKYNAQQEKLLDARVDQLESWHSKTKSLLPVIKTFLALTGKV